MYHVSKVPIIPQMDKIIIFISGNSKGGPLSSLKIRRVDRRTDFPTDKHMETEK